MNKFLRFVSLMLVIAMLVPMTPVELFAAELGDTETQVEGNGGATEQTVGEETQQSGAEEQPVIVPKTDFTNPQYYTDTSGNRINSTQRVHFAPVVEGDLNWLINGRSPIIGGNNC